jgi:chromosome segregation ATPase
MSLDLLNVLRDVGPYVAASVAIGGAFVTKRTITKNQTHEVIETVDDSVLGRFEELFERIGKLEKSLDAAKEDLAKALFEIGELRRLEEYLQGKLHDRDKELAEARERILWLEQIIKDAGSCPGQK